MRTIPAKTILSSRSRPDPYFGGSYNINLYRGCQHGCIYCDTRSDCYRIGDLSDIRVKENALQILDKELRSRKKKGTITTGSMNDPYMPVEKKLELTRGALKLIKRHGFGVHILTKGDLVLRDIDLLKDISKVYCAVSITITTIDDKLSKKIEPNAPPSSRRFDALKKLSNSGIYSGIILMPLLPYITDSPDNITAIIKKAVECKAKYILFCPGMTLRDSCRDYYYKKLDQLFPGMKKTYMKKYGERYSCGANNAEKLSRVFYRECKRQALPTRMDFYKEPKNKEKQMRLL
ncbi:radical SAM protein [Candidatus Woesearchaeota archaeon]|nr:radical SAM protein [Candidatus Woesearchaeota archaeon]